MERYAETRDEMNHAPSMGSEQVKDIRPPLPSESQARAQATEGIERALNATLKTDPEWAAKAYTFLEAFAREHESFISEDVSDCSRRTDFPQPRTDRAWGSIYVRAAKNGLIVQDHVAGRSRRRHNSICLKWRSLVYGKPAPAPEGNGAKPAKAAKVAKS